MFGGVRRAKIFGAGFNLPGVASLVLPMNTECPNCATALEVENFDGSDLVCPVCSIAFTLLRSLPPPIPRQVTASDRRIGFFRQVHRHPVAFSVGAAVAVVVIVAGGIWLTGLIKDAALESQAREMVRAEMARHDAEVRAQTKRDNEEAAQRAMEYRFNQAISKRQVLVGMTFEQVKLAWGKPERINTSGGRGIDHEQWVYGMGTYLYFENGKLTSWQNTKKP